MKTIPLWALSGALALCAVGCPGQTLSFGVPATGGAAGAGAMGPAGAGGGTAGKGGGGTAGAAGAAGAGGGGGAAGGGGGGGGTAGAAGAGGTAGNGGGGGSSATCTRSEEALPQPATLMLVVYANGDAKDATVDMPYRQFLEAVAAAVGAAPPELRAGLHVYPSMFFDDDAGDTPMGQLFVCDYNPNPFLGRVAPGSVADAHAALTSKLPVTARGWRWMAPGGRGLDRAWADLAADEGAGARVVLLFAAENETICWGGPEAQNGFMGGSGFSSVQTRIPEALGHQNAAPPARLTTVVLAVPQLGPLGTEGHLWKTGISSDIGPDDSIEELSGLARAGGMPRSASCSTARTCAAAGTCCYWGLDALPGLLERLAGRREPCVFKIPTDAEGHPERLTVTVAGRAIPRDGANGWDLTTESGRAFALSGEACARATADGSKVTVTVAVPCEE